MHFRIRLFRRPALTLLLAGLLSACGSAQLVTPYKVEVVQGNVVTREQAQALQPGMARAQVVDILGTPLLASVFHADRWDYVFTLQRQGQAVQRRRFTVHFQGDVLERFEGDELPTEAEFVSSLDTRRRVEKEPVLQATPEQLEAFRRANPPKPETPPPAVPANKIYPPLEPAAPAQ